MCYMVYIASSKPIKVDEWQDDYMRVKPVESPDKEVMAYLSCENVYSVSSKMGCGCEFRIAMARDMGFTEPQDWYPESEASLTGTALIYRLLQVMAGEGARVELLSLWSDYAGGPVRSEEIDLQTIGEKSFRMFENRKLTVNSKMSA